MADGRELTAKEKNELENKIRELIGKNYSDFEIIQKLDIRPNLFNLYKKRIYDIDRDRISKLDSFSVFSDYCQKSSQMIKELDQFKIKFNNRGQWNALVQAIKEKREIYQSVIKLGQELGFIERKGKEVTFSGEMSFATYTTEQIKEELDREVKKLNRMANGEIINMRPEILDALDEDTEKLQRALPNNVVISDAEVIDEPVKVKTKVVKVKKVFKLKKSEY